MTTLSAQLAASAVERAQLLEHSFEGASIRYWRYSAKSGSSLPKLVMIHGYRGNHHGLEAIVGSLPDFEVYVPDLPGFGISESPNAPHSIETYSRWLRDFLSFLSIEQPPILIGHSFGTIVTAATAPSLGNQISKLILINPVSAPVMTGVRGLMAWLTLLFNRISGLLPIRAGEWLLRSWPVVWLMSELTATTRNKELRRWIHQQHHENFSQFESRRVAIEAYQASISTNVSEFADRISVPVLLIIGEKDNVTKLREQLAVQHKFANAQLRVIPATGHLVHYETPEQTAEFIRDFTLG